MDTWMKTTVKAGNRLKIWEIALLLGVAVCLLSGAKALHTQEELADKVVRLHVLANSDSEEDQALKLQVRDAVLDRAEALLAQTVSREEAEGKLRGQLLEFERLAEAVVRDSGYDYEVTAELADTEFPTREYEGFMEKYQSIVRSTVIPYRIPHPGVRGLHPARRGVSGPPHPHR